MIAKLFNSFNSEKKRSLLASRKAGQKEKIQFCAVDWRALVEGEPAISFSDWRCVLVKIRTFLKKI